MAEPADARRARGLTRSHAAFAAMREAALAAEASAGVADRWYAIAGQTLQARFAGPALVPVLAPAFEPLAASPTATPDLLVHVWDSASTGVDVPPRPEAAPDAIEDAAPVHAVFQPEPMSLSLGAPALREAIYWVPDAEAVTVHQRAAPLRAILDWWQRERGRQLVHGGAVGTERGGVLLAGASGSGKSTTALACLLSGLDYLGDDYVLLGEDDGPAIHGLYSAAKLNPDHAGIFPGLAGHVANAGNLPAEKALWFVQAIHPERFRLRVAARAVVVPRVAHADATRVTRISSAAALLALAPSTIVQLSGAGEDALTFMARFVGRLPCYRLELGREPRAIADAVRALLQP